MGVTLRRVVAVCCYVMPRVGIDGESLVDPGWTDKKARGERLSAEPMSGSDELERLYDEHAQALFAYLLNFTRSESDTRDLLQEVFMKLVRQPGSHRGWTDPRAFLIRLAHNLAVDLVRRRSVRDRAADRLSNECGELFESSSDPDEAADREGLAEAMGRLPEDQRVVLHLKLWEDMTFEAIAQTLGISANTAASR